MNPEDADDRLEVEHDDNLFSSRLTRGDVLRRGLGSGLALGIAGLAGAGRGFAASDMLGQKPKPYNLAGLVSRAKAEGTLTFYSAMPSNVIAGLAAGFTAEYGIHVNVNRVVSAPQAALLVAETQGGKHVADVAQMSDLFWMRGADKLGFFRPPPANLPGLQKWPASAVSGKHKSVHLQAIAAYSIQYNTNIVQGSDIPTTWGKFVNPKFKGKLLMTDPRGSTNVLAWLYLVWKAQGDSFLTGLAANDLKLTISSVTGSNLVASGDIAMQAPTSFWTDYPLMQKGAPVNDVVPPPGPTTGAEDWMAIMKGAPHPNAALLFFNYALTVPGQIATCKALCQSVRHVAGSLPLPKSYVTPPINLAVQNKKKILGLMNLA